MTTTATAATVAIAITAAAAAAAAAGAPCGGRCLAVIAGTVTPSHIGAAGLQTNTSQNLPVAAAATSAITTAAAASTATAPRAIPNPILALMLCLAAGRIDDRNGWEGCRQRIGLCQALEQEALGGFIA